MEVRVGEFDLSRDLVIECTDLPRFYFRARSSL